MDTKHMLVIPLFANRSVPRASQSSAFQIAVERAVHKRWATSHFKTRMGTCSTGLLAFSVPVVRSVKNEAYKRSVEKFKVDRYLKVSGKALAAHETKKKGPFSPQKTDSASFPSL